MNTPSSSSPAEALRRSRREKLQRIVELGHDPWGHRLQGRLPIGEIRAMESQIQKVSTPEGEEEQGPKVLAAGRIMLQRKAGKLIFIDIRDWTGKIQLLVGKRQVGEKHWALAQCLDLGDLIAAQGELKHTRTGELSIFVKNLWIMSKALEPPPEKHHGLTDPELRQRLRYLDLIYTPGVMERFQRRTAIVKAIRRTLDQRGYVEVEGPTLQTIAGGAAARPFETFHNALGIPLYLRIALELHLKRLLVGGMERVYELGRVYRNEGISPRHNPEFTMLEAYEAYGDYHTMMDLTEQLVLAALEATGQGPKVQWGDAVIDFTPPFQRATYDELFAQHAGVDPGDEAAVAQVAQRLGIPTQDRHPDVIKNEVFEELVEPKLTGPVFVLDYPASICPLTKRKRDNPQVAERFELFIQGMEVANAYTELNDPDLQEQLFRTQLAGLPPEESMARMDHDFIRALRYGMPPAGGLGIGVDRLTMLLTGAESIREVILFPLLRPEKPGQATSAANPPEA